MTLQQLRAVVAVDRHRSFTRAARELGRSQSAVSRAVAELERQLDVSLFERLGQRVHPTEAGSWLATEAQRTLGDVERLEEHLRSAARPSLRVGASTTPGIYLLPPVLGRLRQQLPDLRLHYEVTNSVDVARKVLANELDVGVIGGPSPTPGLVSSVVAEDRVVCVGWPGHPSTGRVLSAAELVEQPILIREEGSATRSLLDGWLRERGLELARPIVQARPEAIKGLVRAGLGIAFLSIHGLRQELDRGELVLLEVERLQLTRPLFVVLHPDKRTGPAIRQFRQLLRAR